MRARFYSPQMKRFVNQDVLLEKVEEGQTLNRYAFVSGRPVSLVDPFGLAQQDLNRAIDIVKIFLPCIYNPEATVILGNTFNYLNLRHWMLRIEGNSSIDGYTIGNHLILDEEKFGQNLFPYRRKFILDNEGNINSYETKELKGTIVNILAELLEAVIHEYQHSNDYQKYNSWYYDLIIMNFTRRHPHIYFSSRVLSRILVDYMILDSNTWEDKINACNNNKECNILNEYRSICPWVIQNCSH